MGMIPIPSPPPHPAAGEYVNAAPFSVPHAEPRTLVWEDPREIHRVVVRFAGAAPEPDRVHLEYWTSRWPEQRLPKDREPGGGDVGWWELGNWYTGRWQRADTVGRRDGNALEFTFRPINQQERKDVQGFPARYRYTLKLRVTGESQLPPVESLEAYTDSVWADREVRLVWQSAPQGQVRAEAFNGYVRSAEKESARAHRLGLLAASNTDPNSLDRTLVTVRWGKQGFTFRPDDLNDSPLLIPHLGVAVLPAGDGRDYGAVERARNGETLYDRVSALPEQTWRGAWAGMPAKRSRIYLPLGPDGGRQRFRLDPDGSILFRTNDHFLRARPGQDTARLELEGGPVRVRFAVLAHDGGPRTEDRLPEVVEREIEEGCLPICHTRWEVDGLRVEQTALVTELGGTRAEGPVPAADATAVFMARFTFTNPGVSARDAAFRLERVIGDSAAPLSVGDGGILRDGEHVRGQVLASARDRRRTEDGGPTEPAVETADNEYGKSAFADWGFRIPTGESVEVLVKIPYVVLTEPEETVALERLSFDREREAVAGYWRRRLDEGARLITPEPMLNEFYRAHAGHLLINCEREPGSDLRFARVGSFAYGAYGNESCMMVADLDRRGYQAEARQCLDGWLKYQGTAPLPGDFDSHEGVLYGAGGYEAGGYNQHHGWILWCLAEHYRYTRDREWLRHAAPGILAAADWIIRERTRTAGRKDLSRGLLPAGSLEDIQDWWPWLSTNCYTWRGLNAAAWALEEIHHPEAARIRKEADAYHTALLVAFRAAMLRSPVVRLRDGTAVPHFPSHVARRGRSFGWICETLEGALHLLISGALDAHSPEAEWILKDYEDNLYLSNQYGYTVPDFERQWFGMGGMSMQACLLLDVEPYLYRDDVKQALRAMFNAIAVGYFPDTQMLTEHALPDPGDWRGDHYKSSDEANAAGWLRQIFLREEGDTLLVGQAVPREWLAAGKRCGLERACTYFGEVSVVYEGGENEVTAHVSGPTRNPPRWIRVRFREPHSRPLQNVTVNGKPWKDLEGEWVRLPGNLGQAEIQARWRQE